MSATLPEHTERPKLRSIDGALVSTSRLSEERDAYRSTNERTCKIQADRGKLTARERLSLLFDDDTFVEFEALRGIPAPRPAVITGSGLVDGARVFAYAQDFGAAGGSVGTVESDKICRVIDAALAAGSPIVAINDGGGARIQEASSALEGYGRIFARHVAASGVIPQICVVLGPCAGGAAYAPALCDVVFMVDQISYLYLTGPDVVKAVTGENLSHQQLGGAAVHSTHSGVAAVTAPDETACFDDVRTLLTLLPPNNLTTRHTPATTTCADDRPELRTLVPENPREPYDIHAVITALLDDGYFFELFDRWAPNVVVGLGELGGTVVGMVANQPKHMAGALDAAAAEKAARFVRLCDAFGIPLISLVDVPGFLPGAEQERLGAIRRGAKLLHAYCAAEVPRLRVILRKAAGGAYIVMDSRAIGNDYSVAWPSNQVAVMGAEGAIDILHRRELAESARPQVTRQRLVRQYERDVMGPHAAAAQGYVDDVIDPADTRTALMRALKIHISKRPAAGNGAKHANIPL